MNSVSPLVSILTPAYNAEIYISQAITSIIDQSYSNWELIIIDDGSSDSTKDIIKSFQDSRIKLITQSNSGVSRARNRGLEIARGKYITFLDADDILPPQSISLRVQYLEANRDIDLVDGEVSIRDENMQKEQRRYTPYYRGKLLKRLLRLDSRVFLGICYFFKASLVEDLRFRSDITHCEDIIFYIELAHTHHIEYGFIADEIYWYRKIEESAMSDIDGLERGYLSLLDVVNSLKDISISDKLYLKYKISKILFLSWIFDAKNIKRAFLSLLYSINLKKPKLKLIKSRVHNHAPYER